VQAFISTLAIIGRLALPYFRSQDRWPGRILLAAVIAIELSIVAITVMINQWNARFYNALQERNWNNFAHELLIFCMLGAGFIALAVYQLYLNQWLQIRWRHWMTEHYLHRWLNTATHYRMQLVGDAADNPDQRIAEDIRQFIEGILGIGLQLLNSCVTLLSFFAILWALSAAAPLHLFGVRYDIPGYLLWAALIYAFAGTLLTHWIGRPLINLNFQKQRYEADFRFNLVRARENAEQIALSSGEPAERQRLLDRFGHVVGNWIAIMTRTKKLTFFTAGYAQASVIFPFIVVSPAYFANAVQLGGLMQTANAFNQVQNSLSVIINIYRTFAEWRAVIERLSGFDASINAAQKLAYAPPVIEVTADEETSVAVENLSLRLPNGVPLLAADDIRIGSGEWVLVTGASGTGKSTLLRAMAGIWPFGSGSVVVPRGARVMMLPQRPYFPVATLAAALAYPDEPGAFGEQRLAEVVAAVGLPALVPRLLQEEHWNHVLSLGEQQRLAIARAILQQPDFLFLDEATASLDEPAEAALYRLLQAELAGATIVSVGHRTTLRTFHRRRLTLVREGERCALREATLEPAAE
jgi:vitamin B12/bleomycin/antimicrobial peptide transport system ATP-binding/permease protein